MELELLVAGVGHVAAQVEVDSRGAQRGPGHSKGNGVRGRQMAHAHETVAEDGIAGEQVGVLVDLLREGADEGLHAIKEVEGRLHGQAADADVAGHHALAGYGFKEAENVFALAEGVKENGERADVHGVRAEPDQVGVEAAQLGQQDAQPLGLVGNFQAEQLFHGQSSNRDCWRAGRGS